MERAKIETYPTKVLQHFGLRKGAMTPAGWMFGIGWIVVRLARATVLNNEIAPVPVDHLVASGFHVVPVGHQPVFVVADEHVGIVHAE